MEEILKLQQFKPEKLVELCRMHLTFTLDLHDDEFSALMDRGNGKKKNRGYLSRLLKEKPVLETMPLNQETISHVYQIIEFLGREINVHKEGLFRKTGSFARQNELKMLLRLGENIDFSACAYTVHDCACVLKSFLAELPEPLLSEAHYSAHCQITDMNLNSTSSSQAKTIYERQLKATKLLLLLLPPDNYCLLKYLLLLLNQIQNAQEKNKMTSENLATLFAPHIICPRKMLPADFKQNFPRMVKCITFLIDNATVLFDPPQELVQDVLIYLKEMSYEGPLQSENHEFQKENNIEIICEPRRKHFRSRSVGDAIKRHILKGSSKKKEEIEFRHSSYEVVMAMSKSTESIPSPKKSTSVDALYLEEKDSKFSDLRKNFLRSSRKKVQKLVKPDRTAF
ncbi:rho GTPase-activating protein 19-like isoform X2 [Stegodyphus dumicola]|uniref:rho GTPase-activating protein 19-like isoform X2 n=1 Tax=Stegodyphus dumicola TaxID=202533 RepID=UPI0015AF0984|nr:rho GTPase-activating protein 19-like isoform X2 [Stegodyphus dumicola]